jgi:hypothetical protein
MTDRITVQGVDYLLYSLKNSQHGGINKSFAVARLKHVGIKVIVHADECFFPVPHIGHYRLLVEAAKSDTADTILFGE